MRVRICVIQPRQGSLTIKSAKLSNHLDNYEVIVADCPSSTNSKAKQYELPTFQIKGKGDLSEISFTAAKHLIGQTPTSVIPMPLPMDMPSSSPVANQSTSYAFNNLLFYCIVAPKQSKSSNTSVNNVHFESFGRILKHCSENRDTIEYESKALLLYLEKWLEYEYSRDTKFMRKLFCKIPASQRIKSCAHNPAYEPEQSMFCHKVLGSVRNVGGSRSSELAEETQRSNVIRNVMMSMEKYDMLIMNPLYGSGLDRHNTENIPYYAKERSGQQTSFSSLGSSVSWSERYPLHKAAYDDNAEEVKRLLKMGLNANEVDNASWTPLHYCAFYNNLKSIEILLVHANTDVNVQNKAGSTPLHFAALQAHPLMVELLLSHSSINTEVRDLKGQRPLDVCACVPKNEHQIVAELFRTWRKLEKIQVDLMDGGNAQLSLTNGEETTALQLHSAMCKELKLTTEDGQLFAIWICSKSLSLQLKKEHQPLLHMKQWSRKVEKFGKELDETQEDDAPRLVFRRDAHVSLDTEKRVVRSADVLSLLYAEAYHNYMQGFYPCGESDLIVLSSIVFEIMYGKNCELKTKMMEHLMPIHRIPLTDSSFDSMKRKIKKEIERRKTTNIVALHGEFLRVCWHLSTYGATFFDATVTMQKPWKEDVFANVGVNDYALHIFNSATKKLLKTYPLEELQVFQEPGKPYFDVRAVEQKHSFTIRTPQASLIKNLLLKTMTLKKQSNEVSRLVNRLGSSK